MIIKHNLHHYHSTDMFLCISGYPSVHCFYIYFYFSLSLSLLYIYIWIYNSIHVCLSVIMAHERQSVSVFLFVLFVLSMFFCLSVFVDVLSMSAYYYTNTSNTLWQFYGNRVTEWSQSSVSLLTSCVLRVDCFFILCRPRMRLRWSLSIVEFSCRPATRKKCMTGFTPSTHCWLEPSGETQLSWHLGRFFISSSPAVTVLFCCWGKKTTLLFLITLWLPIFFSFCLNRCPAKTLNARFLTFGKISILSCVMEWQ